MRQRALIDINTLLDTRLGTLVRLDPIAANLIARSDWYSVRDTDRFDLVSDGKIDKDEYETMYRSYEVETLANSLLTDFMYVLRSDIQEIYPKYQLKEISGRIRFDINIYPYKLNQEEKDIIRMSIGRYLSEPAEVYIVSTAYHLLTPAVLSQNYDMMALYNYEDWLKYHHENLYKNPIQDFTIFSPRIAPSGIVPESDEVVKDPFMVAPLALCRHIQLHPVETTWMSWNYKVYDKLFNPRPLDTHQHLEAAHPELTQADLSRHQVD